jgi:cytochrome c oxidase subunit 2
VAARQPSPTISPLRAAAFVLIAVGVLAAGIYLAADVFLGQRGGTQATGVQPMRISMAGFDPAVLNAEPGQRLTIDWWNTDGAVHLQAGVHTLVSDALGIRLELPAESRKLITITAPMTPGDYDFWCDSCCGGRDSPNMHGTLHVAV